MSQTSLIRILLLISVFSLSGCGQKGPLVLPASQMVMNGLF